MYIRKAERIALIGVVTSIIMASFAGIDPGKAALPLVDMAVGTGNDAGDNLGHFVEHIPDITGDGLAELMTGAPYNNTGGAHAGAVYIYFSPLKGKDLSAMNANVNITGVHVGQNFGYSGAYLPNARTDQQGGEIIIGCPGNDSEKGAVYIFELNDVVNGGSFTTDDARGFILGQTLEKFGFSVAMAGDVNNDMVHDILIGAPNGTGVDFAQSGARSGRAYIVYGGVAPLPGDSSQSDVVIPGFQDQEKFGFSVSHAGDVNGDGKDDIIIGTPENLSSGKACIFFGGDLDPNTNSTGANATISVGTNGLELGYSVNCTGDFNGDGIQDVIIGAPGFNGGMGAAFVVFGNATLADLDLGNAQSGFVAFLGNEVGRTGHSVSGLGDMDADGFDDCIIGAPLANETRGFAYSFFGNATFDSLYIWTGNANATGNGTTPEERFGSWVSEGGDVDADAYMDAFCGAPNASWGKGKAYVMRNDHLPSLNVPVPVSPAKGNATTAFTYRVIYTDLENDPPAVTYPRVRIYKNVTGGVENATTPNSMLPDPVSDPHLRDGDYTNGEQYYFTTKLISENPFNYRFEAMAENGATDQVNTSLQANNTTGPMPLVDTTPPKAPANVTVVDTPGDNGGSITVSWNPLTEEDFHSYELYIEDFTFSSVQNTPPPHVISDINTTEFELTAYEGEDLQDYKSYWVAVGSKDDLGNRWISLSAHEVIPKDNDNLLPGNITDLNVTGGTGEGEVLLTWTAVGEDNMTNGPVEEYIVKFSTIRAFIGLTDWDNGVLLNLNITPLEPGEAMVVKVTGLPIGVKHYFAVKSVDSMGQMSGLSNSVGAFPSDAPDVTPPEMVLDVSIFDIDDDNSALGILWSPDKSIDFDHYNIYISTHSFANVTEPGVYLENSSINEKKAYQARVSSINGNALVFGETYYAAVTAVDKSGNENKTVYCSEGVIFRDDLDRTPPLNVTNVLAEDTDADSGGSLTVIWDKCAAADFLLYRVYISKYPLASTNAPGVELAHQIDNRSDLSAAITSYDGYSIVDGVGYYIAVVAMDFNDQVSLLGETSVFGPVEAVNDSDLEVPPAVNGFKVQSTGINNTILVWDPFTSGQVPDFHQYVILYSTESSFDPATAERFDVTDDPSLGHIGTGTVEIKGLVKETDYYFIILCQDDRMAKYSDIDGDASGEISITTESDNSDPVLSGWGVEFDTGTVDDLFVFLITVKDADSLPEYVFVVIDNESFAMTLIDGNASAGARYEYSTKLGEGEHEYYFRVLDSYFKDNISKEERRPETGNSTLEVVKKKSSGGDNGMSPLEIIILIVILLVAAMGVVAVLIFVRNRKLKEGWDKEVKEEKEVAMWTCSCGEVTVPETEAGHCGFCGGYHEPYVGQGEETGTSDTKYPDYSQGSLYGDVPQAAGSVPEPQVQAPHEEMPEATPSTVDISLLDDDGAIGVGMGTEPGAEAQATEQRTEAQTTQQAVEHTVEAPNSQQTEEQTVEAQTIQQAAEHTAEAQPAQQAEGHTAEVQTAQQVAADTKVTAPQQPMQQAITENAAPAAQENVVAVENQIAGVTAPEAVAPTSTETPQTGTEQVSKEGEVQTSQDAVTQV